jgi:hypothetical protein
MKTQATGTGNKLEMELLNDFKIAGLTGLAEQQTLSKEEQVKFDANASTWTYLMLACKGKAFKKIASRM